MVLLRLLVLGGRRVDGRSLRPRSLSTWRPTARTDTHAALLGAEIATLTAEINNPLTPEPIQARLAARIAHREQQAQAHAESRTAP